MSKRTIRLSILISYLLTGVSAFAQNSQTPIVNGHGTGALPIPHEKMATLPKVNWDTLAKYTPVTNRAMMKTTGASGSVTLPTPPIMNQGAQGSCVGFGFAALMSIMLDEAMGNVPYTNDIVRSPAYIYNQIHSGNCGTGSSVDAAVNLLGKDGVCSWNAMPYNQSDCATQPNSAQNALAAQCRGGVTGGNAWLTSSSLTDIKKALDLGYPIAATIDISDAVFNGQGILTSFKKNLDHCVCIVGYDDNTQLVKVQNSWGTWWGDNGFFYVPYTSVADTFFLGLNVIYGVNYNSQPLPFAGIQTLPSTAAKLSGTVIGSSGSWNNNPGLVKEKGFDGDVNTYYDAALPSGQWLGLDLGSTKNIRYIKFRPRQSYENRMQAGLFQISGDSSFTNPVTLYAVPFDTLQFKDYYVGSTNGNGVNARYIRYIGSGGGACNVAEITIMTDANATSTSFVSTQTTSGSVAQLTGTVIGSTGSWNNNPNATKASAFDGNINTFFDAPTGNGQWVGLDLSTAQNISYIKFRPRQGYEDRMYGGKFQISTDAAFTNPTTVYQIPNSPLSFQDYYIASVDPNGVSARYVRYLSPDVGFGNVAEITVMSAASSVNTSFVSTQATNRIITLLTGTVIGSAGSWNNNPYATKSSAFDGNVNTFFDAPTGNGQWVGLDLSTTQNISYIKFTPRQGYEDRMYGGKFQISTDAAFTNPTTIYQIPNSPLSFQDYYIVSVDPNGVPARYVRYMSPDGGFGNVAEISVMSIAATPVTAAIFYTDCNYGGTSVSLQPGSYNMSDLIADGIGNDALSSLKIMNGYTVTLYSDADFSGVPLTLTLSNTCLLSYNFNDLTSSIKISSLGTAALGSIENTAGAPLSMQLSPNPAFDKVQLHFDGAKAGEISLQVLNLQGQTVINKTLVLHEGSNDLTLERGSLPAGMYIIKAASDDNRATAKVVFE
ncbi:discoidin domain-containing protein [Taibaiella soli]|nr:discoidin domain-containing protein [Taibaiella soli]